MAFLNVEVVCIFYKCNCMEITQRISSDGDFIVFYLQCKFLARSGNIFLMCNQNFQLKATDISVDFKMMLFIPTRLQITK